MKHPSTCIFTLAFSAAQALAQGGPVPLWIQQFGTPSADAATAIAPDGVEGVFITGTTAGSFGGPNAGVDDAFLARFGPSGDRLWVRQFGTSSQDRPRGACSDGSSGVYLTGSAGGYLGGTVLGAGGIFLTRYNADGERIWMTQFAPNGDTGRAVAPDASGGVYAAGSTWSNAFGQYFGASDAFLVRYSSSGVRLWARQIGTGSYDSAYALAPDSAGGVYISGDTNASLGGPSAGLGDAWLARYDHDGDRLWIRQFGTNNWDTADALAPDGFGGVYVAGRTFGNLGAPNAGESDVYLARYHRDGSRLWIRQFGTPQMDGLRALAADGQAGVFVTGHTPGSLAAPSAGGVDFFLCYYDIDGEQQWAWQTGTDADDLAIAAAADGIGGVYITGETTGILAPPGVGARDAFILRFGHDIPPPCYPNCDGSTTPPILNVDDFTCFINEFAVAQSLPPFQQLTHYANCDASTTAPILNVDDFTCFINAFAQGCR